MPKAELAKSVGTTEQMLAPHLRNKQATTAVSGTTIHTTNNKTGIAAEEIVKGQLLYKNADGKLSLADITSHGAEMVAMTSALINESVEYNDDVDLIISSPATNYDDYLQLGVNGSFKVIDDPADGDIFQIVGRAKGSGLVHIKIEQGYPVVILS